MTEVGRQHVALVNGAGALGAVTALTLARKGMDVVVTDVVVERAEAAATGLGVEGLTAEAVRLNITSRADVEKVVEDVISSHGGLDVVVNMMGSARNDFIESIDDDDFHMTMQVHVEGTLHVMRAVAPHLRASGYGRIVNSSSVAQRGSLGGAAYGAAKSAIEGLTRSAALELARHGVTVNCVAPGLVDAGVFRETVPAEIQSKFESRVPMKRAAKPEEIAEAVSFLVSPEASYITGQTLFICGGSSIGF
jgi:3-oxoacyl-[acyl-carrier protein] reductase